MHEIFNLFAASLISSTVVAAFISIIFKKRTEQITGEIKNQFEMLLLTQKSGHIWKEKAVSELFGPLCFQFSRTEKALSRYRDKNLFLETKVLKDGNEKIRNLLLEKSYLIPPDLIDDANALVEHYDVWLEEFSNLRESENPSVDKKFVFVGTKGFPFPKSSETKFKDKYAELWQALYH